MNNTREWFNRNKSYYYNNKEMICINCDSVNDLHLHHIVPLAIGGTNKLSNVVVLCNECHGKIHGVDMVKHRKLQREGIERAKEQGKYKGRKEVKIDNFEYHYNRYMNREVNKSQLARELNISRPTLDKLIEEHKKSLKGE